MKNSIPAIELSVVERSGVLVIDSRLIAEDLGIQHKNFLSTLDKYIGEIEEDWGTVAFETREFKTSQGNTSSERVAFLTEPQATLLMTYSRNTERVRQCKRHLVKAFEAAKLALSASVELRVIELEKQIGKLNELVALLQSQVQTLLPISSDFMPPGWDENTWQSLAPQDKRHFRYIHRRRGFRPSHQGQDEILKLPFSTLDMKQRQRAEVEHLVGKVSPEEQQKLEAAKQEMLRRFWEDGGES